MRKLAAIDIGTNTVLYSLFVEKPEGRVQEIEFQRYSPQIGKKLAGSKKPTITPESHKHLRNILRALVRDTEKKGAETVLIGGTNPFRKAENGRETTKRLEDEIGYRINILSGNREAYLSFLGAVGRLPRSKMATVMDLGGGSTELVTYRGNKREAFTSLPEGAVSLTEEFAAVGKVPENRFDRFGDYLKRYDSRIRRFAGCRDHGLTLVGGTSSALAMMKNPGILQSMRDISLTRNDLEDMVHSLAGKTLAEKRELLTFDKKRARVIFAGAFWLWYLFKVLNLERATATQRGLRHGLALEYLETDASS
jgi:exopolyphosphatase/guanosine-5'-triphosphate,3'-diphosphate pyrophosphatase